MLRNFYPHCLVLLFILFGATTLSGQASLIWSAFGRGDLYVAPLNGTPSEWVEMPSSINSMVLAPESQDLYLLGTSAGTIYRLSLATQMVTEVLTDLARPTQLTIDEVNGKLYWGDSDEDAIFRANLDGSNREILLSDLALNPQSMVVDTVSNKLYFSQSSGEIERLDLTTRLRDTIAIAPNLPTRLILDLANDRIFWCYQDFEQSGIQVGALDGSSVGDVFTIDGGRIQDLALDLAQGKLYWTDWGGNFPKYVRRANLDGSEVEEVFTVNNYSPFTLVLTDSPLISSTEQRVEDIPVQVFPNPLTAGQALHVRTSRAVQEATLWTASGQQLASPTMIGQKVLLSSSLPAGMYYLVLVGEGWRSSQRLVVQGQAR